MGYKFGAKSMRQLVTCHPDLQRVLYRALGSGVMDFGVTEGHRNQADQEKAFAEGHSEKHWPTGNHNSLPSNAADLMPVLPAGVDAWGPSGLPYWYMLAGVVQAAAAFEGVPVRWGGDFNMNGNLTEKEFKDLPHVELRRK